MFSPSFRKLIEPENLLLSWRQCRKSAHGSTSSPRTDHGALEINYLAVRPELVEGRAVDYDTVSCGEEKGGECFDRSIEGGFYS